MMTCKHHLWLALVAGLSFTSVDASAATAPTCSGALVARLENCYIRESSGVCASRRNPGIFWTHNDSGDTARAFLIDRNGATRMVINLRGAQNNWSKLQRTIPTRWCCRLMCKSHTPGWQRKHTLSTV